MIYHFLHKNKIISSNADDLIIPTLTDLKCEGSSFSDNSTGNTDLFLQFHQINPELHLLCSLFSLLQKTHQQRYEAVMKASRRCRYKS